MTAKKPGAERVHARIKRFANALTKRGMKLDPWQPFVVLARSPDSLDDYYIGMSASISARDLVALLRLAADKVEDGIPALEESQRARADWLKGVRRALDPDEQIR